MYSDPSGNSPTKWWEWALAGVAVAGLIVGSIFTCGTLAGAVLAGAALGAGMSLVTQATSGELNWGQFALDTGVGAITGLIGGSGLSRGAATILGGIIGAGSNLGSQLIGDASWDEISVMQILVAGVVGAVASYIGGAVARNKAELRSSEGYKSAASKLSRTTQRIFNGTSFNNPTTAQATFTKAINGLTNAIQMEMSNMFYIAMLSYGVSTIGFSMANGLVDHFGDWAF